MSRFVNEGGTVNSEEHANARDPRRRGGDSQVGYLGGWNGDLDPKLRDPSWPIGRFASTTYATPPRGRPLSSGTVVRATAPPSSSSAHAAPAATISPASRPIRHRRAGPPARLAPAGGAPAGPRARRPARAAERSSMATVEAAPSRFTVGGSPCTAVSPGPAADACAAAERPPASAGGIGEAAARGARARLARSAWAIAAASG